MVSNLNVLLIALVALLGFSTQSSSQESSYSKKEVIAILGTGDMEGKTIIDLSWPEYEYGEDGYFQITAEPSGAEIIQRWIPKASVVKAFGTTGTNVIDDPNDAGGAVTIPIASDHRHAKEVTARLVAELGLDPVDAGNLADIPQTQGAPKPCPQ